MRIVFMGSPGFAVPSLRYLVRSHCRVVAVYTQPDRRAGRGRVLASSPTKEAALELGIPVVQPDHLRGAAVAELAALRPDIVVAAAFGQILPQTVLDIPLYGCLNIHPSLLPRHRGASPAAAAILAGDEFTGVSIMQMEAGLDTGPVLSQAQILVLTRDTTGSLTARLAHIAAGLLGEVLVGLPRGEIIPRPQNDAEATYSGTITKGSGEIDWHRPAVAIWRQVRAYQPWPGCYTRWRGRRLEIVAAVPLCGEEAHQVGQVVALPPDAGRSGAAFGIGTGGGTLGVVAVQLEGKRVMPAAEFLRGQPGFIGAVLPS